MAFQFFQLVQERITSVMHSWKHSIQKTIDIPLGHLKESRSQSEIFTLNLIDFSDSTQN